MNNQAPVPSGWIQVPDSPLYFDPATQSFMTHGQAPQAAPNQYAWGDQGLQLLGGTGDHRVNSFLDILQEYSSGAPIDAGSWQEAVQKSLEGFMRTVYTPPPGQAPRDPATFWDPEYSGTTEGSQFHMGEFQDLVRQLGEPFFDPGGVVGGMQFNAHQVAPGQAAMNAFPEWSAAVTAAGIQPNTTVTRAQWDSLGPQMQQFAQSQFGFIPPAVSSGRFDPLMGLRPSDRLLAFEAVPTGSSLEEILGTIPGFIQTGTDQDFKDFLFKLNIDQYAPPAPIMRATPESVLEQFFDTAPYRLAFGNDPGVLDASLDPTERFRFDPGYQFAQDEGLRQLQFDQSKRGLLESGRGMRDIEQFSQGLADQNYQRYLAQNMGLFSDWTNRIQGVAGAGAQAAGQMSQNDMTLGQLLGAAGLQTGTNLANLTGQTGSNIANLFGSQGVFGASSLLNTGAAQSSNIMQSAAIQAQIAAANAASQSANSASSGGGGGGDKGGAGQALGQAGSLIGGFG